MRLFLLPLFLCLWAPEAWARKSVIVQNWGEEELKIVSSDNLEFRIPAMTRTEITFPEFWGVITQMEFFVRQERNVVEALDGGVYLSGDESFLGYAQVKADWVLWDGLKAGFILAVLFAGVWSVKGIWRAFLGGDRQID